MQELDHEMYLKLSASAAVLERDKYGDKVLRLKDGSFFKLFRRKRVLSSAMLYPYAQRFADNAHLLKSRKVPCPSVLGVYRVSSLSRDLVHYAPLPGETLRHLYRNSDNPELQGLRKRLGAFVAGLHDQGIYFRSLHLGNIVLTPDDQLGLIDIADLKGQGTALGKNKRLRNFKHLLRYAEDRDWLLADQCQDFFDAYLATSQLRASNSFSLRLKAL
ncbi:toluene tolerance protein [Pseudomonas sp. GCM10022186]|uniref:toluene tolerance protein n=1 Tax=Pseudomonas sp. GCM10022186 TaxID=3252650 RepID=UPI003617BB88